MSAAFSSRTMTPADWAILAYFRPAEFAAPEKMGYEFMLWLDRVRVRAGVPMVVTSSFRTPAHNAAVAGAADSAHTDVPCDSVDIGCRPRPNDPHWNYSRWQIVTAAMALDCTRLGIYHDGSLHLDRTEHQRPAPRLWVVVDSPAH